MSSIIMSRVERLILTQVLTDEVIMTKGSSNHTVIVIVTMFVKH